LANLGDESGVTIVGNLALVHLGLKGVNLLESLSFLIELCNPLLHIM